MMDHDWPQEKELVFYLKGLRQECIREGWAEIEVRLQVTGPDDWQLHSGDAQFDQDHCGCWGASYVQPDDTDDDLKVTAGALLVEAGEDYAEWLEAEKDSAPEAEDDA